MSPTNTVIFTHIPKTAGTTLYSIVFRQYLGKPGAIFKIWHKKHAFRFMTLSEKMRSKMKMIKGHAVFGLHQYNLLPSAYFTFFRDPVKRTISTYRFILDSKRHPFHNRIVNDSLSLKQLLRSGLNRNLDNCHVRYLAGIVDAPFGHVNEQHLQTALENMEKYYVFVGIKEYFDESLLLLSDTLEWKEPPYYIKRNVTSSSIKPDIDEETMELLRYYNRFDQVLYDTALKKFEKQLADAGPAFQDRLAEFREQNKKQQKNIRLKTYIMDALQYFSLNHLINMWIFYTTKRRKTA